MAAFQPGSTQPDTATDRGKVQRVRLSGAGDTTETLEWVDVALQTELDAHAAAADPHPGYLTAAEGNAAYEAAGGLAAHLADTVDAHDATAISFAAVGTIAGADVQTAVAEVATDAAAALAAHEADTTSIHGISNTANLYAAGGTDVAVTDGGTGASDAPTARSNLGLVIGTATGNIIGVDVVDAKGDLIVATAANTITRLAVGSNTQVLTADSAEASGVKWAAAAGGSSDPLNAEFIISGRMFGR